MLNTIIFIFNFLITILGMTYHTIIIKFFRKKDETEQYDYVSKLAYKYASKLMRDCRCKLQILGKENIPEGGIVFIANHESFFDIPALITCYGHAIGFIAKKETNIPILSTWIREMKSIFIDRSDVKKSIQVINQGIQNLKEGYPMAVFPEGKRSKIGKILEFKKGSLRLGTKSGVPIVPVVIKGTRNIFENNKFPSLIKRVDVTVCFLEPIKFAELSAEDQKNITAIVENRIKEKFYSI